MPVPRGPRAHLKASGGGAATRSAADPVALSPRACPRCTPWGLEQPPLGLEGFSWTLPWADTGSAGQATPATRPWLRTGPSPQGSTDPQAAPHGRWWGLATGSCPLILGFLASLLGSRNLISELNFKRSQHERVLKLAKTDSGLFPYYVVTGHTRDL